MRGDGLRGAWRTARHAVTQRVGWQRAGWRHAGWRKALPVGVAATAALGVAIGVGVTALSGAPAPAGGSLAGGTAIAAAPASSVPASVAALPPVAPVTGKAAARYLPTTTLSLNWDSAVPAIAAGSSPGVAPLKRVLPADLMIVAPFSIPPSVTTQISRLRNVTAVEPVEAVRMRLNGSYTAVLGVDPSGFRSFVAAKTAQSDALWRGVAGGGIAVSYTMGKLDALPLGGSLTASGRTDEKLTIVAFGTLGIGGVDAVVSHQVARSLGAPADNAIVVSVRGTGIGAVAAAIAKLLPPGAGVEQLVSIVTTVHGPASGAAGVGSSSLSGVPASAIRVMLQAAMSRQGMPYVWGGSGPTTFDCSGLVQWSFRQAGITMPRVAADQARTGPAVPVSQLQPGDLLFYHTDATAPDYISHVTIYLGNGWMIEAPQPGENVKVVPVSLGSEFAGAVRVSPAQAAAVAAGRALSGICR